MRVRVSLIGVALLLAGCGGSPSNVFIDWVGLTDQANQLLVVRIVEGKTEKPGTKQSIAIGSNGNAELEFLLVAQTPYQLQYYVDLNGNAKWDGPVDVGEPSWNRTI